MGIGSLSEARWGDRRLEFIRRGWDCVLLMSDVDLRSPSAVARVREAMAAGDGDVRSAEIAIDLYAEKIVILERGLRSQVLGGAVIL